MNRTALRHILLLPLLFAPFMFSGAQAQTGQPAAANELVPSITNLPSSAFTPTGQEIAEDGSKVIETTPRASSAVFTDMLLRWQAREPEGSELLLEVRVSKDGRTWTDWKAVTESDDPPGPDDPVDAVWSNPIATGDARFYQFRATLEPSPRGALPTFSGLQIHTVDTRIANEQSPQAARPMQAAEGSAQPAFVSRTAWGSPDGEGSRVAVARRPVTNLVVHHTADSASLQPGETNYAQRVRAYWTFHAISRGWGDIGYNWLIDPNGVVYEGRSGSSVDTSAGGAVGFHDTANYGSMGVALIGTFANATPSAAAQNSLVNLLAWKAKQRGIDPFGKAYYLGCAQSQYCYPYNPGAIVPTIAGHRQVKPGGTTCPGDAVINMLPTIKQRVYQVMNNAFGPTPDNGDTTVDERETTFIKNGAWYDRACGFGGHTYYTYASNTTDGVDNTNDATWIPNLPKAGYYRIRASIPQGCGIRSGVYATDNARYQIYYANGQVEKPINQDEGPGSGDYWVDLGTYLFNEGRSGSVKLADLTNDDYNAQKVIFFDAVKWEYVGPPPAPAPVYAAQLLSATAQSTVVPIGGRVRVEFKIKNTGTAVLGTQLPDGSDMAGPANGWEYPEWECFLNSPTFQKQNGKLRATLGFADGSARVKSICSGDDGGYPWRWGTRTALNPGETRTIVGYVRFSTPGTYTLEANLVNEYVGYYGADGNDAPIKIGPITVKNFPFSTRFPFTTR